jgi:SMC interacting uncharacterized protein involved in chromosome segregation
MSRTITAEEAKAAREALKTYRAAEAAALAARKARREERAEAIAQHREAIEHTQHQIEVCRESRDAYAAAIRGVRIEICERQEKIVEIEKKDAAEGELLRLAYSTRSAAVFALRKLNAEIRGDNGDDTDAADAEALVCEAEHARDMREGR